MTSILCPSYHWLVLRVYSRFSILGYCSFLPVVNSQKIQNFLSDTPEICCWISQTLLATDTSPPPSPPISCLRGAVGALRDLADDLVLSLKSCLCPFSLQARVPTNWKTAATGSGSRSPSQCGQQNIAVSIYPPVRPQRLLSFSNLPCIGLEEIRFDRFEWAESLTADHRRKPPTGPAQNAEIIWKPFCDRHDAVSRRLAAVSSLLVSRL